MFYDVRLGKTLRMLPSVVVEFSSRLSGVVVLLLSFICCTCSTQLFFIYMVGFLFTCLGLTIARVIRKTTLLCGQFSPKDICNRLIDEKTVLHNIEISRRKLHVFTISQWN